MNRSVTSRSVTFDDSVSRNSFDSEMPSSIVSRESNRLRRILVNGYNNEGLTPDDEQKAFTKTGETAAGAEADTYAVVAFKTRRASDGEESGSTPPPDYQLSDDEYPLPPPVPIKQDSGSISQAVDSAGPTGQRQLVMPGNEADKLCRLLALSLHFSIF